MALKKGERIHLNLSPKGSRITRREVLSLKAEAAAARTWPEICADYLTNSFGTITFFLLNFVWFAIWIIYNSGVIQGVKLFDSFPFNFLTMTVSLEAIFLSIIVLISQNRAATVDQLREEIDLNLDLISEQEITKIMEMLAKLMEKNGLDISKDAILQEMLKPTDTHKLENDLKKQM